VNSFAQEIEYKLIPGITKTDVTLGNEFVFACKLKVEETLKPETTVFLYGTKHCSRGYDGFYKVMYNGKTYLADDKSIIVLPKDEVLLRSLDSSSMAKMEECANKFSKDFFEARKKKANLYLEKGQKDGILLKDASVYDESEYTKGTGFKVTFTNPSKKTIKYISFTVTGINPVNDIVSTETVKGVGPITSESEGEYTFEYLWRSDLVSTFKIPTIKIQYMDGTFKTILNAEKLMIPDEYYNILYAD